MLRDAFVPHQRRSVLFSSQVQCAPIVSVELQAEGQWLIAMHPDTSCRVALAFSSVTSSRLLVLYQMERCDWAPSQERHFVRKKGTAPSGRKRQGDITITFRCSGLCQGELLACISGRETNRRRRG